MRERWLHGATHEGVAPARIRRRIVTGIAAVASTLALTSCTLITTIAEAGSTSDPGADGGDSTLFDADLPESLRPYYEQDLTWSSCEGNFECATATAPMNWDDASAGDIDLALLKVPATGTPIGTLFINPGGPGASGTEFATYAEYIFGPTVLANYDIVGWDPRGVGKSTAVECLDDAEMDEYLYPTPAPGDATMSDEQIIAEAEASAAAFGAACLENTGPFLEFVDTMSTIRDLDMLRAAAGDAQLHYLGFSYGTDIGAQYINEFPQRVGRVVLDGATDPTLSSFEVILGQQAGFAAATEAYLNDCRTSAACPFTGTNEQILANIKKMMLDADVALPKNSDGRVLTSSVMSTAISQAMYAEHLWPQLTAAFTSYSTSGSPEGFFGLADMYNDRNPDGTYASNMMEAFTAINCLDYAPETDPAKIAEFNRAYAAANPLALPGPEALGDVMCNQWPFQSTVTHDPVRGEGAAPVLVVGTTGDPATPYPWAQSLADQLESATLVTYEGEGHTAYGGSSPCINNIVDDYLVDGIVPSSPPTC